MFVSCPNHADERYRKGNVFAPSPLIVTVPPDEQSPLSSLSSLLFGLPKFPSLCFLSLASAEGCVFPAAGQIFR